MDSLNTSDAQVAAADKAPQLLLELSPSACKEIAMCASRCAYVCIYLYMHVAIIARIWARKVL